MDVVKIVDFYFASDSRAEESNRSNNYMAQSGKVYLRLYASLDFYLQLLFIYILFISLHANRRAQNYTTVIIVGTQHCKEKHLDFSHAKKKTTTTKRSLYIKDFK